VPGLLARAAASASSNHRSNPYLTD
jgi:hypothetical protein